MGDDNVHISRLLRSTRMAESKLTRTAGRASAEVRKRRGERRAAAPPRCQPAHQHRGGNR
jgi:hypothetical protein